MQKLLETERLYLDVPREEYYEDLLELRTDIEVMRCLGGFGQEFGTGVVQSSEQVKEHIDLAKGYYDEYGYAFFCAFEKETNEFVGQAGLFHLAFNVNQPEVELAYRLHKRYWGKGYATELAIRLIDWGLNELNLPRILAPVHPGNARSINVLEKAGMKLQGDIEFRGHMLPCYIIEKFHLES